MARGEDRGKVDPAEPIRDGDRFREAVERHSGERWPVLDHLEAMTGILAGNDGPGSFGIFCRRCAFGVRSSGSSSATRERFADEADARSCGHWPVYREHPAAFFGEA